jgi:hypothetical protein
MPDVTSTPNLSPDFAEMAARHRSKARSLRFTAKRYVAGSPRYQELHVDAEAHDRLAVKFDYAQAEQRAGRDGMLAEFRKSVANRGVAL